MCLILLAVDVHERYRWVIAGNRDEYYERPTRAADFWPSGEDIFAGRDERAGGTWMGVSSKGRFATLTNYRDLSLLKTDAPSRGVLVKDFLLSKEKPAQYFDRLAKKSNHYSGFSMIAGANSSLGYYSNVENRVRLIERGVFGLSNNLFDVPWPKVETGKRRLTALLDKQEDDLVHGLLEVLQDSTKPPDDKLPDTGVGLDWERTLSSIFIRSPGYGTRASSVVLFSRTGEVTFVEQTYKDGKESDAARWFRFSLD